MKGTVTVIGQGADTAAMAAGKNNKQVIIKSCSLLTDCINEINSTQVDNAKYLCIIIPMSNSIEYSNNYLKMPESFTAIL